MKKPTHKKIEPEGKEIMVRYVRCPRCGWKWKPRVKYPAECPNCKIRLGWPGKR